MFARITFAASIMASIPAGACVLTTIFGAVACTSAADDAQNGRGLLRFDPLQGDLAPVSEEEAKPGCVYNHFSERLNRRVWAIRRAEGGFSNALGEGTTQTAQALDIRGTTQEKREKLAQVNKDLLTRLEREGGKAFFRLTGEGRWELDPIASASTVYDAETLHRWEWVAGRYLPVSSAPFAYRWQVVHGEYVAAEDAWPIVAAPDCNCQP
jgi:hypothetical protein